MAIFSNTVFTPVVEQSEEYIASQYPNIMPTVESAYEIACEGHRDINNLIAGMYISDILIEEAVNEGAEAEPLVENAVKDFIKKAKKKFEEIKNKIVAWFKKVWDSIKMKLTSNKEFVKKYEDQIRAKAKVASGYKVTKHNFNTDIKGTILPMMDKIVSFAEKSATDKNTEDFGTNMIKDLKYGGATTISELKEKITNNHVGKEVKNTTITSDVEKMIKYCLDVNVTLGILEDLKDGNVKKINEMIKSLDGSGEDVAVIHGKVKCFNTATSTIQQLNTIAVSLINQINKEYVALLRGLMAYKVPTKESYTSDDELMGGSSIFEAAMSMI